MSKPNSKVLETGSPEQVALAYLAKHERLEAWELHHMARMACALPQGYGQERLVRKLRVKALATWKGKRWHITNAGLAEDARHRNSK